MGSDYYFRMGSTHAICQDYAIAGTVGVQDYALLSDGCSGTPDPKVPGSPYTDFGARFLVLAAQRNLRALSEGFFPERTLITEARAMRRQCGLGRNSLDATLLAAVSNKGYTHTYQTGDGVVGHRYRDGKIRYTSREFGNNMPYYLNYVGDDERENDLLYPDPARYPKDVEDAAKVFETNGFFDPETKVWTSGKVTLSLHAPENGVLNKGIVSHDDCELTLLMSDGVHSFHEKATGKPVPLEEILTHLFDIPNYKGVFLVRNCNHFLQKICVQKGWQHADDFSIAGIHHGDGK